MSKDQVALTHGNIRRWIQLRDAALNLGMRHSDARFYAFEVLKKEMADWRLDDCGAKRRDQS